MLLLVGNIPQKRSLEFEDDLLSLDRIRRTQAEENHRQISI